MDDDSTTVWTNIVTYEKLGHTIIIIYIDETRQDAIDYVAELVANDELEFCELDGDRVRNWIREH